ncbi:liver-expressed antimicrobial peptide 2-like [Dromaius novaehollandiae]|uniref:liver-expressed antimicrobial peptide 2-like n=1 Tax=Dromaius novaehollandiae TaxID=8790 RepID=UPI000E1F5E29|nr:liver-expressed antimicrobial peptide 2-like [Dromaius novaehollandiae]
MTAPIPAGPGRGGTAGQPLRGPRLALLFSILLLLSSSVQGRQELRALSEEATAPAAGHPARRLARMTPFWRTVGSKPPGAHCQHSLECITKACRAGRCATPQYEC